MKQIPIAIVGLNFGRHIVNELLQEPGRKYFRIAAVCDLAKAKAEAMGQRLKCKVYTDLDDLLADQEIPAIGLYTGPGGRAGLLRRIIRAGKDVMTTKPFELDPKAALVVLREAQRRKRVIHLNSPAPLTPSDLQQISRWHDEFKLGRPIGARADVWANYREKADGGWYDNPKLCPVAPIFRLGIYLINDLVRFFGEPSAVQVFHSRLFTRRPTPDNAQLGVRFKNGGLVNIFSSFCVDDLQSYRNCLTLNFERGTIYRNPGPIPHTAGEKPTELALVTNRQGKQLIKRKKITKSRSGGYQWAVFYRAIHGAKLANSTTPEQIVAGLKIISAMTRAEQSGKTEKV